jgi:hypothetical protein
MRVSFPILNSLAAASNRGVLFDVSDILEIVPSPCFARRRSFGFLTITQKYFPAE